MRISLRPLVVMALLSTCTISRAGPPDFSGHWSVDLRNPAERKRGMECGSAEFDLAQQDTRIVGSHSMATVGCGRLNEGGDETVKGVVVGDTAVLVVTSGRNGAVVMGTAKLRGGKLHWQTLEDIRPGEPEGDSPLIMGKGVLVRVPR
jgi:hypothetical protein